MYNAYLRRRRRVQNKDKQTTAGILCVGLLHFLIHTHTHTHKFTFTYTLTLHTHALTRPLLVACTAGNEACL